MDPLGAAVICVIVGAMALALWAGHDPHHRRRGRGY